VITADQMIVHTKGSPGTVTFESNVVVQDAQFQLRCQRLIALVDPKSRRIIRVDATGGVTLNQQNRVGRALRATYTPEDGKVVLEGDPRVESPEGVVSGKIITYYRDSDKIVVSGGTRMEFDADKPKQTPQPAP
jgi:lipopolysaccharide export system protein LptA